MLFTKLYFFDFFYSANQRLIFF